MGPDAFDKWIAGFNDGVIDWILLVILREAALFTTLIEMLIIAKLLTSQRGSNNFDFFLDVRWHFKIVPIIIIFVAARIEHFKGLLYIKRLISINTIIFGILISRTRTLSLKTVRLWDWAAVGRRELVDLIYCGVLLVIWRRLIVVISDLLLRAGVIDLIRVAAARTCLISFGRAIFWRSCLFFLGG